MTTQLHWLVTVMLIGLEMLMTESQQQDMQSKLMIVLLIGFQRNNQLYHFLLLKLSTWVLVQLFKKWNGPEISSVSLQLIKRSVSAAFLANRNCFNIIHNANAGIRIDRSWIMWLRQLISLKPKIGNIQDTNLNFLPLPKLSIMKKNVTTERYEYQILPNPVNKSLVCITSLYNSI